MKIMSLVLAAAILLLGCTKKETPAQAQLRVCTADIKEGLNDPNSFELLSSRPFKVSDDIFRLEVKFTAKNAMGGRVRGEAICGFKTEASIELNPEDFMNQTRTLSRQLKQLGVK